MKTHLSQYDVKGKLLEGRIQEERSYEEVSSKRLPYHHDGQDRISRRAGLLEEQSCEFTAPEPPCRLGVKPYAPFMCCLLQ